MTGKPILVVKVGGSLLDWPDLPDRLGELLSRWDRFHPIVVVGGGGSADVIRHLDLIHHFDPVIAHELAVRSLDLTARILEKLLAHSVVVDRIDQCVSIWNRSGIPILAPRCLLDEEAEGEDPLPSSWDVTTDSIAARVAIRCGAEDLLLVKSTDPPREGTLSEAANQGFVDAYFPVAARGIKKIHALNLRKADSVERVWNCSQ